MYKHELYKIFTKKSIYAVLLLSILFLVYGNWWISDDDTLKSEKYDILVEEWGGPLTDEKLEKAKEYMELSDAGESRFENEESRVHTLVGIAGLYASQLEERKHYLTSELHVLRDKSYEQKAMTKELNMLKKLKDPFGFYLIRSWKGLFEFIEPIMSVILLATLIVLGITPLFIDEYSNRTIHLLLTTKNGKKKIVTSKVLAMITYITVIFVTLHFFNFIIHFQVSGGVNGWDAPMQNLRLWSWSDYSTAPFHWNILQFYFIVLGFQYIACVFVGLLVMFLSIVFKNTLLTLLASGAMIGVPTFLGQFSESKGLLSYIYSFNYVELLKANVLFETFSTYNLFGTPVLYPVLLFTLFALITAIIIVLIYQLHQKTEMDF